MKYDSYKHSGIEWLGEIPADWKLSPLKYMFTIQKRIAGEPGHTVLSITQLGIKPKDMSGQGQFAQDYSKYQRVYPGDFAMNHMDLLTGWVDLSQYEGVTSPDYRVFSNNDPGIFVSEYYKYIFQYCYSGRVFYGLGQGVSGYGRWRLPAEMFLNFKLPIPSEHEQRSIVEYLDRKVLGIESIIAEARTSIEEHKAWKASIIYEAVTKGLNPNVELKDSGVDWIGNYPCAWDIKKAKFCISISHGSDPFTEGEIPVYGSGASSFRTCGEFKDGPAVLVGRKGATLHIPHFIQGPYWNVDTAFDCKSKSGFHLKFYYYCASVFDYKYYISQTTLPSMTQTAYNNMYLPCPTYQEQEEIVAYLDTICEKFDAIIVETEKLVDDLESYKKSLIFEVVTGKRKVV